MTILIPNLAIGGYRSFGHEIQFFETFSKVNLFIGQNNSGKSNVLRFLAEIYPQVNGSGKFEIDALARHMPTSPDMVLGIAERLKSSDTDPSGFPLIDRVIASIQRPEQRASATLILRKLIEARCRVDSSTLAWTLVTLPSRTRIPDPSFRKAIGSLDTNEIYTLWQILSSRTGGDRKQHWEPEVIDRLCAAVPSRPIAIIPAVRRIGEAGSQFDGFDGTGIIEQLAQLQNPGVSDRGKRVTFDEINEFLKNVLENSGASIEIPYERNTILVRMDGKLLPIDSVGSGVHEVVILAAASTLLTNYVICIEEPELHLNPILQRKLVRYLSDHTKNQYFITTHSAALMDTPGAEVYHLRLQHSASVVERATSDRQRSAVCEDLGYHPSDLLQSNCILWVEGPSDRVYLNWWIRGVDPTLVEGVHYSIMFYGGRLASHLSNAEVVPEVENFISLRRLNQRGFMLLDSDRDRRGARIGDTKKRLRDEFNSGPGFAWITEGREIENYIPETQIRAALTSVCPNSTARGSFGKFENVLKVTSARKNESTAPKVEVARFVVENSMPDYSIYDLKRQVGQLVTFIRASNPTLTPE